MEIAQKIKNYFSAVSELPKISNPGFPIRCSSKRVTYSLPPRKKTGILGFTLIELLIVISILGILAAIAIPAVQKYIEKGKIGRARGDLEVIAKAILTIEGETGFWPNGQSSAVIVQTDGNEIEDLTSSLVPSFMASVPRDPWGNNYFLDTDYIVNGRTRVVVGSYGPNGVGLNQYDSDDVIKILR